MEHLSSRHNPRFKSASKLLSARERQKQGRILVIGNREVDRAVQSGLRFEELFISPGLIQSLTKVPIDPKLEVSELQSLLNRIANPDHPKIISTTKIMPTESIGTNANGLPLDWLPRVSVLDDALFSELTYGDRQVDIVGVANRPPTLLANIPKLDPSLLIVLESLEKPGNLGAIVRSADGCGVSGILLADPMTDIFHPNSIRSSMATVFSLPIATASVEAICHWLVEHDHQVLVGSPEAEQSLYDIQMLTKSAIVLGNEARGVSHFWRNLLEQKDVKRKLNPVFQMFHLPMNGIGDSLNVAVTGSIVMYEWLRRNR